MMITEINNARVRLKGAFLQNGTLSFDCILFLSFGYPKKFQFSSVGSFVPYLHSVFKPD